MIRPTADSTGSCARPPVKAAAASEEVGLGLPTRDGPPPWHGRFPQRRSPPGWLNFRTNLLTVPREPEYGRCKWVGALLEAQAFSRG